MDSTPVISHNSCLDCDDIEYIDVEFIVGEIFPCVICGEPIVMAARKLSSATYYIHADDIDLVVQK